MDSQNNQRSSKKLKKNIIFSSIYQISVMIVPIITTPYVTRIFNVNQMGDYGLSTAISSFFVVLANFGLSTYGSRKIAQKNTAEERTEIFYELWIIQIIMSILSFVLYCIIAFVVLRVDNQNLFIIQSVLILVNILDISWFFIGLEELSKTISRNLITKIFTTICILLFVKNDNQLYLYASINVIGTLLGNFSMFVVLKQFLVKKKLKFILSIRTVNESFFLLIPILFTSFYKSNDRTVLQLITRSSTSVGFYDQGQKIINLVFSVFDSAISALTPRMSYYVGTNRSDKILYYLKKSMNYSSLFSIIIVSGIISVSDYFVDFFFGNGYGSVAYVLKICSIAFIFMPISIILSKGILIPLGKDKEYSNATFAIGLSNILMNIILIPSLSYIGTCLAYVFSEVVGLFVRLYYSKKYISLKSVFSEIMTNSVVILLTCAVVISIEKKIFVENSFFSFIIFGFLSVIISIILYSLTFILRKNRNLQDSPNK